MILKYIDIIPVLNNKFNCELEKVVHYCQAYSVAKMQ